MKIDILKVFKGLVLFLVLSLLFVGVATAQSTAGPGTATQEVKIRMSGIVPTCYTSTGDVPCESFTALIAAVRGLLNWVVGFTLMFTVVIIAYAGYLYLTSGSNPGNRSKANGMFVKVFWGIVFILGAWIIVNFVTGAILDENLGVLNILK